MSKLASSAIRYPRRALGAWLAIVGVLGLLGLGVESKLHRSDITVPGSTADRSIDRLASQFGQNYDAIVLLKGPRAAIDRQGRRLSDELLRIHGVSLVAPWFGLQETLRPSRDSALVVIRTQGRFDYASKEVVPQIREAMERTTGGPVRAHMSGYADIGEGIHEGTVEAIAQAEIVAVPLLLIILLLVFRSPIAALLPLFVGLTTIGAARGALAIVNQGYDLDALSLNIASMMGLALGVDYALLMVSRFREELLTQTPFDAAMASARTAGHTVASAGVALVIAMVATIFVVPGGLLVGVGIALIAAVVLSVLAALIALPASLALLGPNVDRWTFGDINRGSRFGGLAMRAVQRPLLAGALVLALVLALSTGVLALETGPPDPRGLPAGIERDDYLAIADELGGGWIAPYEIAITTERGPLTERRRLEAIERFQRRMLARDDVAAVLGPGQIARRTAPLAKVSDQMARTNRVLRRSVERQGNLADGLARVGDGVGQLRQGLDDAAAGAGALEEGGHAAVGATERLQSGLGAAHRGAEELGGGLLQGRAASRQLAEGSADAAAGASRLEGGLARARRGLLAGLPQIGQLRDGLAEGAGDVTHLRRSAATTRRALERGLLALDQMQPVARSDPAYARAHDAIADALTALNGRDPRTAQSSDATADSFEASLASVGNSATDASDGITGMLSRTRRLAGGLGRLESGVRDLARGLGRLDGGAAELASGFDRLSEGGAELAGGVGRLEDGSGRLAEGVGRLSSGLSQLQAGLERGAGGATPLERGVDRIADGVLVFRARTERLARQARQARRLQPAYESGYFVLAALDRARPALSRTAAFALSVDRGGRGARVTVIGHGAAQKAGHPLRDVLERELEPLSKATGGEATLSGTATALQDFDIATSDRLPLLALVLSLVTFVALVAILRSLLLPLIAVLFNLLTVAAAFGVMVFCFQGADPLLGGPGFVDAITAFGVFSIMFGLSIDYEVFLLTRMREGFELTGTTDGAIRHGVQSTAGVITGAALIMTGVFVAFATTGITAARQLGLALTIAILLDATLIRLVLLPAAMRLCGDANWWLPAWLKRILPAERAAT